MKRLHVHVAVDSIEQSTRFYSDLFGAPPTVQKSDYAKWMLDDPRVNFAISARGREAGLDHLGIQVEAQDELKEVSTRLETAGMQLLDEGEATCCYAKSEKAWVIDPQGIAWETFLTTGTSTVYGDSDASITGEVPMSRKAACCAPADDAIRVQIERK
jgi:catechol-2,3-dioxygenase